MNTFITIYLVAALIIFISARKTFLAQITQKDQYVNLSQYGLLLMSLTFPITFIIVLIDLYKIQR